MRPHGRRRLLVARIAAAAALLVGLVVGCDRNQDSASAQHAREAAAWKDRYESLVRKNEEIYRRIEELESRNAALLAQIQALKEELAQRETPERTEALRQRLTEQEEAISNLRRAIAALQAKAAEQSPASAQAQLEALKAKATEVCSKLEAAGGSLFDAGRYRDALAVLTSAAELGSTHPSLLFQIAYCHGELGDDQVAATWYAKAAETAEKQPQENAALLPKLYNNYGATLVALGKPQEALAWYKKAIEADPDYAPAHFNLGRLYAEHLSDPGRAIQSYRRHVALAGSRSVAARDAIRKLLEERPEAEAPMGD